jgi:hypothetical protein
MKRTPAAISLVVLALCACASKPPPSDYDPILARPNPSTYDAQQQECSWIETALARQKSQASYVAATAATPMIAIANQDAAQRNMAVLEARATRINCRPAMAFPTSAQSRFSFDECFARCRQYTGRSNDQCFDACNK